MTSIQYNKRGADQHIVIITCIAMLKPQMYWLMGINMSAASHTQHRCGEACSGHQLQEATTSTQSISVPWNITNSKNSWKPCFANADSRKIFMFQTVQSTPMKGFPATSNTNRVALEHYYKIQLNPNIAAITPNLLTGESQLSLATYALYNKQHNDTQEQLHYSTQLTWQNISVAVSDNI